MQKPNDSRPPGAEDARLDALLDAVRPVPESPWFAAKTMAAIREENRRAQAPGLAWLFTKLFRPATAWGMLAAIFLAAWVFLALEETRQPAAAPVAFSVAPDAAWGDSEAMPTDEEIVADLEIYLADLQSELWASTH